MIGLKGALNNLGGAVVLDLLAAHNHGNIGIDRNASGNGKGGVGNSADDIIRDGGREGGGERQGDLAEEGRVGDDEAEVDVDRGGDAGFEFEIAKLDGCDVMEAKDERLHRWEGRR